MYGIRYAEFVIPLVKAVQELSKENDELKSRLDKIEQILAQKNEQQTSVILSSASIEQNIPNPFNQNTLINYYIPQNAGNADYGY